MEWLNLFIGFFLANALGYGGGPASIPLMYEEVVEHYQWTTSEQFSNILAVGNALPGPIATKIAAYVGYVVSGWPGMLVALTATVLPSALALIVLSKWIRRYRQSSAVKGMTLLVQPVVAVLMAVLTWQLGADSFQTIGLWHSLAIAAVALWAMQFRKIHPATVIIAVFLYGGLVLPSLR